MLNAFKVIPFAPAVPSMQKLVILSFAAWVVRISMCEHREQKKA
jgi:hypothetical protein